MQTLKSILFDLFKSFFKDQLHLFAVHERFKCLQEMIKKDKESKRNFEIVELDAFIGKPVICISNEWETPNIGYATRIAYITQAADPVLCVYNCLDNKEYFILGKVFLYTEQRFNAIFKLDPFELCSFIYGYSSNEFNRDQSDQLLTKEEVVNLLDVNGFYEKFGLNKPII